MKRKNPYVPSITDEEFNAYKFQLAAAAYTKYLTPLGNRLDWLDETEDDKLFELLKAKDFEEYCEIVG